MAMRVLGTGLLGVAALGLHIGALHAGAARPEATEAARPQPEARHPVAVSDLPPPERARDEAGDRRAHAHAAHPIILSDIPPPEAGCARAQRPEGSERREGKEACPPAAAPKQELEPGPKPEPETPRH